VQLVQGKSAIAPGPFNGAGALPARYAMFRAAGVDEAANIAAKFGRIFGDVTVDVRPVNEAWDLGFAPKPEGLTTRRYMAVVNADAASEAGAPLSAGQKAALKAFADELTRTGAFLGIEHFEPSRKGKRLRLESGSKESGARKKFTVLDGPFAETKELIGGFAIVQVPSLEDAVRIGLDYGEAVEVEEMDVRGFEKAG
jgi:hypothetical protein